MNYINVLGVCLCLALLGCQTKKTADKSGTKNINDSKIIEMRFPQGGFDVTCKNGTKEIVSYDQLKRDDVCNGNGTKQEVVCAAVPGGFVPVYLKKQQHSILYSNP